MHISQYGSFLKLEPIDQSKRSKLASLVGHQIIAAQVHVCKMIVLRLEMSN